MDLLLYKWFVLWSLHLWSISLKFLIWWYDFSDCLSSWWFTVRITNMILDAFMNFANMFRSLHKKIVITFVIFFYLHELTTLIFVDLMNFINMFSKADTTWKCGLFYLHEQYGMFSQTLMGKWFATYMPHMTFLMFVTFMNIILCLQYTCIWKWYST